MEYRNTDVTALTVEIPEGHRHLRTTITFADGTSLTLQEATVANLLRAFVEVKSHPIRTRIHLEGRELAADESKEGFARWQLLETDE